jgi:outer membrane protein
MNRNKRFLIWSCLLLLAASPVALAQSVKVGVFNAQVVSENTQMGQRIQAELTVFTERKESEIVKRQERLAALRQQLSQQSLSLSSDKRSALEMDVQRHALELQSFQEAAGRELELEYASATRDFQDKLVLAVDTFGSDEGFSILLDRSQVAWAASATDVTSAIIDRFNRMFPVGQAQGADTGEGTADGE